MYFWILFAVTAMFCCTSQAVVNSSGYGLTPNSSSGLVILQAAEIERSENRRLRYTVSFDVLLLIIITLIIL